MSLVLQYFAPRRVVARLAAVLFILAGTFLLVLAPEPIVAQKKSREARNGLVARGAYIVNGIAMCGQCHTPRTSAGGPDRTHWLDGAPLWLLPAEQTPDWPLKAPRIAGTPPGSDSDLVTLLTTGTWKGGERLRPPMPQFHMSREDAESVVAYLRSLNPGAVQTEP